jgi:hypothetical protein
LAPVTDDRREWGFVTTQLNGSQLAYAEGVLDKAGIAHRQRKLTHKIVLEVRLTDIERAEVLLLQAGALPL